MTDAASEKRIEQWADAIYQAQRDLHEGAIVRKNGKLFESACGVEALGNPLSVVSWLANELAKHERQIEVGQLIATGSLTTILPAEAGDTVEVSFAHLGCIRFAIV
jgi:2-keto-4-pentenoate hydratase